MGRITAIARHWPLGLVLAAGLALRVPHAGGGHHGDILNYSRVAAWLLTSGSQLDIYRDGFIHAFPYAHPPLGIMVFAPFNALALAAGASYVHTFHYLMYAFEAASALVLYAMAWAAARRVVLATAIAAYWFIGSVSPLWLPGGVAAPDSNFTSLSTTLVLVAVWLHARPRWAGVAFGLALATRSEVALLVLPWALHYQARSWTAALRFAVAAAVVFGVIVAPFALRDFAAFDWAVRGHIAGRLSDELPLLWRWLEPLDLAWLVEPVRPFNTAVMGLAVVGVSVACRRDPWLVRLLLIAGLTHALTMPVLHTRYVLYVFALALAYVAASGAYVALAGWSVVRLAAGLSIVSLGPVWAALVWNSRRAAPLVRDAYDPAPAQILRWIARAPRWSAPAAVTLVACAVGLARASPEPRVEDSAIRLLSLVLLPPPLEGPGSALALPAALVGALPFGSLAWRLNTAPLLAVAAAALAAGSCAAWLWNRNRPRAEAHAAGALGSAFVALLTGAFLGVWTPAPERDAYRSLTVLNLEQLERDALLCVERDSAGLWAYAQRVDGVRPDVTLAHGSAAECAALAAEQFGSRPVYLDGLSDDARRTSLVFFPARGVWRAVSQRAPFTEGALIKGPDERIYRVEHGRRRWIPTLEVFTSLGLRWEQVQLASYDELAALPPGAPLG